MKRPVIGILTWRNGKKFREPRYFRHLIKTGNKMNLTVFMFSPHDVSVVERKIKGFVPSASGSWICKRFPWPDIVIDRFWYSPTTAFAGYRSFRKQNHFFYANSRLADKWKVHQVLQSDERMHRWLPETRLYTRERLLEMHRTHRILYVKPINGTGGRGILRVARKNGLFELLGRDKQRVKKGVTLQTNAELTRWISRWVKQEKFLVQQGLDLSLVPGRTCDMRLLIQKNESGEWEVTGFGVRIGPQKSATSNLHGGGEAIPADQFLTPRFGVERTEEILAECQQLALQTAETVENHFGRMLELGLDIGIDVSGKVWLIEVNPKPGRNIFREMKQHQLYRQAVRRPLEYAMHLVTNKPVSQLIREEKSD